MRSINFLLTYFLSLRYITKYRRSHAGSLGALPGISSFNFFGLMSRINL